MRWTLLVVALGLATPAFAQSRLAIGGGVTWTAGIDAGGHDAELSRGGSDTPLTLFSTSARVRPAAGVTARVTYFLTPRLAVEGAIDYSRPALRVEIGDDFEGAVGDAAAETLSSYLAGGSVLYRLSGARLSPFVLGGAGYLRQLDGEQITLVTGSEWHGGAGVLYDVARHVAFRVYAVVSSRSASLTFDDTRRAVPVVSGSLSYRF
jgi:hypothetical protein